MCPYIKKEDRICWDFWLSHEIRPQNITKAGTLNYIITKLCLHFLNLHGECYDTYNMIIGVLECAKQEFYRKQISIYEEIKIKENGDLNV